MNRKIGSFLLIMIFFSAFGMPKIASSCGTIIPAVTNTVPDEVANAEAYYGWGVPEGFTAINFWMQALHHTEDWPGVSEVKVDWMRMYCRDIYGADTLLESKEYNAVDNPFPGGLFIRTPWFANDASEPIPNIQYDLTNGYVIFTPGVRYDRVWHWWGPRALIPADTAYCWMEARVYVQGPALVQAGMEFWRDLTAPWDGINVNNTLLGVSDWVFESAAWQTISVVPLK